MLGTMTRSNWIALIVAIAALALFIYFAGSITSAIWSAITWIGGWVGTILLFLWSVLTTVGGWIWTLLVMALQTAMPFLIFVATFVMVVGAFTLSVGFLMLLSLMLAGYIGERL